MGPAAPAPEAVEPEAWYGNIQYILNISTVGASSCVLLFLLVKLRFDHRCIPGPSALAAKLLVVYHATAPQIALHCGTNAAQFLLFERVAFLVLAAVSLAALAAALPLNLLAGDAAIADQFAATTISHIPRAYPLLWLHLLLVAAVVAISHLGISRMEDALRITRLPTGWRPRRAWAPSGRRISRGRRPLSVSSPLSPARPLPTMHRTRARQRCPGVLYLQKTTNQRHPLPN